MILVMIKSPNKINTADRCAPADFFVSQQGTATARL